MANGPIQDPRAYAEGTGQFRSGDVGIDVLMRRMDEIKRLGMEKSEARKRFYTTAGKFGFKAFQEKNAMDVARLGAEGRGEFGRGGLLKWAMTPAQEQERLMAGGMKRKKQFQIGKKKGIFGEDETLEKWLRKSEGIGPAPDVTDDLRSAQDALDTRVMRGVTNANIEAKSAQFYADQPSMEELNKQLPGPRDIMGERYEEGKLKQYTRSRDPSEVTKPAIFEEDTTIKDWWDQQDQKVPMDSPIDMQAPDIKKPYVPYEQTPEFGRRKDQLYDRAGEAWEKQISGEGWYDEKGDFQRGSKYRDTFDIEKGIPETGPIDPLWRERKHFEDKGGLENVFEFQKRGTEEHGWLKKEGLLGGKGGVALPEEDLDIIMRGGIGGTPESNYFPSPMEKFLNPPEVIPDIAVPAKEVGGALAEEVGEEVGGELAGELFEEGTKEIFKEIGSAVGPGMDIASVALDPEERDFFDIAGKGVKLASPLAGPFAPAVYAVGALMDFFG